MAEVTMKTEAGKLVSRDDPAWAGQAAYTPLSLLAYDWYVLGFSARYLWRCPTARMLALYDENVSERHLDVGVGTGYYLDECRFPVERPSITLLDANPSSLAVTARRIARHSPRVLQTSVLAPIPLEPASFGSIGLTFVLHCLPGPFSVKAAAFEYLAPLLEPGGVLFGATVLGRGVPRSAVARAAMAAYNWRGIFSNATDDPSSLDESLSRHFARHEIAIRGCVALFRAYRAA